MITPRERRCRLLVTGLTTIALSSSGALFVACRRDAPRSVDETDGSVAAPGSPEAALETDRRGDASGQLARGLEERADEARRDAGELHGACEGAALSLLTAAVDPRCAVTEREWNDLVRAADSAASTARVGAGDGPKSKVRLRQEARREGDNVVVSIVNGGSTPLVVPLRYHPGHPELAFSVLAESEGHGVFELAAPRNDAPAHEPPGPAKASTAGGRPFVRPSTLSELDAGAAYQRVHSARIRLPPGGVARARLVIDPRIVKRLDRTCSDAGARSRRDGGGDEDECLPARLPKGRVVLHVGQLVTATEAGEPARVEWDAPPDETASSPLR